MFPGRDPQGGIISQISDKELKGYSPLIDEVWQKMKEEIFLNPDYTVLMSEFIDIYGRDEVEKDKKLIRNKQERIRKLGTEHIQTKKMSDVFEGIVSIHAELSNWFGNDAMVLRASLFDDYFNGVDFYSQWGDRLGSAVAFAADITFSQNTINISNKLDIIKQNILRGRLTRIKYYKSPCGDFKGVRENVPHVILVSDPQTVMELSSLYMRNDKKSLAEHPIQIDMLHQISYQFEKMYDFSRENNAPEKIIDR